MDSESINGLSKHMGYASVANDVAREWLQEILDRKNEKILVSESNGEINGWIHAFKTNRVASPPFIEIAGLVVAPDNRRNGVGTELVQNIEHWAKNLNLKVRVRSNLIREETHKFYEALGFVNSKTQHIFEKSV